MKVKLDEYEVYDKKRKYEVIVFQREPYMWAFDAWGGEPMYMVDGDVRAMNALAVAYAVLADFPSKIIYFPVKSDGIGKCYKENYNLVLVRANLQFRRSYWYGIKPRLDKKHWKGKFVFQYDSQKLCDFYHKKIENAWDGKGRENGTGRCIRGKSLGTPCLW